MTSENLRIVEISDHGDVVERHHRFENVQYRGIALDLSHLDAFALRIDPGLGFDVDVVILFSCHCFTISTKRDGRAEEHIPADEIFDNGRERRVICLQRYSHSKALPKIIKELEQRRIQVAASGRQNFVTFEGLDEASGSVYQYAVFFEVVKDRLRKKRILLYVQSAYVPDKISKRQQKAGKVNFATLLRKTYVGEKIRG